MCPRRRRGEVSAVRLPRGALDLGEAAYWSYVKSDPGYNLEPPDPYGFIDGGMNEVRAINSYQLCRTTPPWKSSALIARLIPEIMTVWDNPTFFAYVDRWVNHGVTAQPDPCAPVSQGGGPDGEGGCVLDPDLTPGSTMTTFTCQPAKRCGRWPDRDGTHKDDEAGNTTPTRRASRA